MSYEPTEVRHLTREEQQILHRALLRSWKPIGESANEIVARLERKLDTDWIVEYLAFHGKQETEK